jgi:hypothetical protein
MLGLPAIPQVKAADAILGGIAVLGALAMLVALFAWGWHHGAKRATLEAQATEGAEAAARQMALETDLAIATDALAAATKRIQEASGAYEQARSDLSAYRDSLGSRYGGVRLCREATPGSGVGTAGGPATGPGSAPSSGSGGELPDTTGPDLGALAADAEELRQRAILCAAYVESVEDWTRRVTAPKH